MTTVAYLLIVLGVASLAGVAAMLVPVGRLNPEHPFQTDPGETHHEHRGRHEMPEMPEGPTRRLGDSLIRPPF